MKILAGMDQGYQEFQLYMINDLVAVIQHQQTPCSKTATQFVVHIYRIFLGILANCFYDEARYEHAARDVTVMSWVQ